MDTNHFYMEIKDSILLLKAKYGYARQWSILLVGLYQKQIL